VFDGYKINTFKLHAMLKVIMLKVIMLVQYMEKTQVMCSWK